MPRIIARLALLTICAASLSCSPPPDNTNDNGGDPAEKGEYDGVWGWYEHNKLLYVITIEKDQVADWQTVAASARRINARDSRSDVCDDGLIALEHSREVEDGLVEFTTLRLDVEDPVDATRSMKHRLGVLPGRRIVARSDLDDIRMFPAMEHVGELRKEY